MWVAIQEFEEWHIAFEAVRKRLRRIRRGVSKKREEEMLWEQATTFKEAKQRVDDTATEDVSLEYFNDDMS
jgi:hypothetical protein